MSSNAIPCREEAKKSEVDAPNMSVVMSVCGSDREADLREALDSLLKQTCRDFEVVVVAHDASERVFECLHKFSEKHHGVRILREAERLSYGEALNLAIRYGEGRYIVHMDPDDISAPSRLGKIAEFLDENPDIDIVGSFIEEFSPDRGTLGVIEYPLEHAAIREGILRRNPIAHASTAVRRDALVRIGTYVLYSIRNEDTLLWLSAFKAGARFANIPEPLYRVRYGAANNSRRTGARKAVSDLLDRLRIIVDLGGGWSDVLFALGVCCIQTWPNTFYQAVRAAVVYRGSHRWYRPAR